MPLLYPFLKPFVRLAMRIFCRKIIVNKPRLLKLEGPLLLACNHPNSFLDSIITHALFKAPVWSLARGDVFKNRVIARFLSGLKILPVYRTSEGVENLSANYQTFEKCILLFRQKQIVQIFSEGKCVNEWQLRPLKKGTARLAIKAWEEGIPLQVLPVGINYSSFTRFGKNVIINLGEPVSKNDIDFSKPDGLRHQAFNELLSKQLAALVYHIPKEDKQKQQELLYQKPSAIKRILLPLPALFGWITHGPLYWPIKKPIWKWTQKNDHYDSAMTGILFLLYPLYLGCLVFLLWKLTGSLWSLLIMVALPFFAWSYVQLKPQLDK